MSSLERNKVRSITMAEDMVPTARTEPPVQPHNTNVNHENDKYSKSKYRKLLQEFVQESSAGGINKVFSSKPLPIRCIWAILCIACYGAMMFLSQKLIMEYRSNPTATFVDVTVATDIDFPAVTICNLNKFRRSALERYLPLVSKGLSRFRQKESGLNKQQKIYLNRILSKSGVRHSGGLVDVSAVSQREILEKQILKASAKYSQKNLRRSGHLFRNLVFHCEWMGVKCNVGYFRQHWRSFWDWKYGNCYTFNFGLDWNDTKVSPLKTTNAGPNFGLQMDIFLEQHEYVPELSQEAGIKLVIGQHRQYVFPFNEGITVAPGSVTTVALRKEVIDRVDPFGNKSCIDHTTEVPETIYNKDGVLQYTVQGCLNTCLVKQQRLECNCTDAEYPPDGNICLSIEEDTCTEAVETKYKNGDYDCFKKCPQHCRSVTYRTTISNSQISSQYQDSIKKNLGKDKHFGTNITNEQLREAFLRVKIYFEELNLIRIHQQFSYPFSNLLADIGGQLGLWVGLSVITFAELGDVLISLIMLALS